MLLSVHVSYAEDILIFFSWSRCEPCKQMKKKTWPNPLVQEEIKRFTFYKVDVDEDPFTVNQYNVTKFPTTIVVNKDGYVVKEVRRHVGFLSGSELIRFLRKK